ncbi:MAG: bifunctional oligoribonuclease/PAP phosphatase NrnA [Clostridia bacterium]|nr:bifunctional oligoribonuclease/PAP phosphatase NrnA [Clostridia bacterium]
MIESNLEFVSLSESEVAERLFSAQSVLILFHINPDGDAVGSAFALRHALISLGKSAWCICASEAPERLLFAVEDSQESVLPESIPEGMSFDLTVSVDTASPSQLGALYEAYKGKIDIMIDHHGKGTPYADNYVAPGASSCGEVLCTVIDRIYSKAGIPMPIRVSELIYTAVSSDTGCFRYNNVSPSTHILAARLIESGVDGADINHKLFGIKTLKQMQVEHAGFERMNFYSGGRIAIITFPYDLKAQYGATDENLETLVDVARCVKGVEVAAVIKQPTQENKFRVSMRSSCDFDVSEICAHYGGGGHVRAAGCTLSSDSILAAEMAIVVAVEHRMQDGVTDKSE